MHNITNAGVKTLGFMLCACIYVRVQECSFVLGQKRVCSLQHSISVAEWFPEAPHKRHCKAIKLPPVLSDVPPVGCGRTCHCTLLLANTVIRLLHTHAHAQTHAHVF